MLYPASILVVLLVSALVAVWLGFLAWGYWSGQFRDPEAAKYRVLGDEPCEREANES